MDKIQDNLKDNKIKDSCDIQLPEVKLSYTKTIVLFLGIVNITLLIFGLIYMWKFSDSSVFNNFTNVWGGLFATAIGFYIWKAKFENKAKIDGFFKIKLKEFDLVETIENTIDTFNDDINL